MRDYFDKDCYRFTLFGVKRVIGKNTIRLGRNKTKYMYMRIDPNRATSTMFFDSYLKFIFLKLRWSLRQLY